MSFSRMTQKALIVRTGPNGHEGLKELNIKLKRGWRVAQVAPMGGATGTGDAPCHAALVIIERSDPDEGPTLAVEALERTERETGTVVEEVMKNIGEIMEENGADPPDGPMP